MSAGKDTIGQFYPPTVLLGVKRGMKIWEEEVFGPVRGREREGGGGEAGEKQGGRCLARCDRRGVGEAQGEEVMPITMMAPKLSLSPPACAGDEHHGV